MTCPECLDQILDLVRGRLLASQANEVRAHLDGCESCRTAYEETTWLSEGLTSAAEEILAGHISSRLLVEFARNSDGLPPNTVELLESHVARCDACREDLETARSLVRIEMDTPVLSSAPRRRFMRRLSGWRWHLPAYATAAVLIIAVSTQVSQRVRHSPHGLAAILTAPTTQDTGHPVFRLKTNPVARGTALDAAEDTLVLGRESGATVVLGLEVVTFAEAGVSYEVRIHDAEGMEVWSSDLEFTALDSGSMWLTLHRDRLTAGIYEMVVAEEKNELQTVISRGVFEITDH